MRNQPIYVNGQKLDRSSQAYRRLRKEFKARCQAINAPCALCHGELGPIDYRAEPGTSRAFEADHKIPTAKRPDLFLSEGNLQPSHLACNRSRQAKDIRAVRDLKPGKWVKPSW